MGNGRRQTRARAAMGGAAIAPSLSIALLLAAGCGSTPGTMGGGSCDGGCWQPTAADEAFLKAFCAQVEPCCVRNGLHDAEDPVSCAAKFRFNGLTRDTALRDRCLAEMTRLAGAADCAPELWDLENPCVRAFYEPSGPQAPGQPCTNSADCAGSPNTVTYCTPSPADLSGDSRVCMRMARGASGDRTCLGEMGETGSIVAAPFYRAGQSATPIASGVLCESRARLYCEPTDDPQTHACATLRADGATCVYPMTCASGSCLTADGSAPSSSGAAGSCTPRVSTGQTCSSSPPAAVCNDTSFCEAGTCASKLSVGAACNDDDKCTSGNCTRDGVCAAQSSAEAFALFALCTSL